MNHLESEVFDLSEHVLAKPLPENVAPSRQIHIVLRQPEIQQLQEEYSLPSRKPPIAGPICKLFEELEQMVGLEPIKEMIHEIYALLHISQYRVQVGLSSLSHVYHMIFKGNPGTGKTTIARFIARIFQVMGVLSKGHLVEVERADMVGEYIGHTALKTRELMKKAMGGILFIDEAYSLARGGDKDFGKEAIDCLVRGMENHKSDFILILAGYPEEMDDFLLMNPGLPSRFPIQIEFADYSVEQLIRIADLMAKDREYAWHSSTITKLKVHLTEEKDCLLRTFSNARHVRNVLEKSIRHQAVRLLDQYTTPPSKLELMSIRPEDLRIAAKKI